MWLMVETRVIPHIYMAWLELFLQTCTYEVVKKPYVITLSSTMKIKIEFKGQLMKSPIETTLWSVVKSIEMVHI